MKTTIDRDQAQMKIRISVEFGMDEMVLHRDEELIRMIVIEITRAIDSTRNKKPRGVPSQNEGPRRLKL